MIEQCKKYILMRLPLEKPVQKLGKPFFTQRTYHYVFKRNKNDELSMRFYVHSIDSKVRFYEYWLLGPKSEQFKLTDRVLTIPTKHSNTFFVRIVKYTVCLNGTVISTDRGVQDLDFDLTFAEYKEALDNNKRKPI